MKNSRWRREPGKNIRNSITNYRFLGFFWTFLKIAHYCGGFEYEMRKVGQILTNLSIAENFKEWKFGQLAWIIGLVNRITTDRTYLRKDVYYGCFCCELENGCRIFTKYPSPKAFLSRRLVVYWSCLVLC